MKGFLSRSGRTGHARSIAQRSISAKSISSLVHTSPSTITIIQPNKKQETSVSKYVSDKKTQLSRQALVKPVSSIIQEKRIQPKISLGQPNDRFEKEADDVANKVVSTPDSQASMILTNPSGGKIQRSIAGSISSLPTSPARTEQKPGVSNLESKLNSSSGGGISMSGETKNYFESRFAMDFSSIRLHTDHHAVQMNRALGSRAFAYGNDIYFNEGKYNPSSHEGKKLLAHELTHTIQQRGGCEKGVQRMLEVNKGVDLDTMGYTVTKSGNFYTCPKVVKNSIHHELFTSLLHSDRIFKLKGKTSEEANKSLKKHMMARLGIIDFASKKKYTFGAGSAFSMSKDFWEPGASLKEKPGVDRKKALADLNIHPENYKIACLAATKLTMEGGSGSASWIYDDSSNKTDWVPGDWGYIENAIFSSAKNPVGYEGENIIYTGKDMFWGHFGAGNTYKTLDDWMAEVNSWYNSKASLDDQRIYTKVGLE